MHELKNKETGRTLGRITDEQLQFLIDHLEEESSEDQDYYINQATIDMLKEKGADKELVSFLEQALQGEEGVEIEWK